jgi:hypothetical protein
MSATTPNMIGNFCTGCVAAAIVVATLATLATITWVVLL